MVSLNEDHSTYQTLHLDFNQRLSTLRSSWPAWTLWEALAGHLREDSCSPACDRVVVHAGSDSIPKKEFALEKAVIGQVLGLGL